MTVSNSNNRDRLTANGVLVDFDFTFKIFANTDILVYIVDTSDVATLKTLTTDYTVDIASTTEGGTVTMLAAPTNLYEVLMIRSTPNTQEADILVNEGFSETVIENALDRLAMQIQQLQEDVDRSAKIESTSEITTVTLPDPEDGYVIGWNGTDGTMQNLAVDEVSIEDAIDQDETAQTAAELAQAGAETAETNAETAETNAANSAIAAAASAASIDLDAQNQTGFMMPFDGAISAIPSGYVICDGANSTSDMTDRLLMHADADAAGTNDVDDTGGAATVTLTAAQSGVPAHTHAQDANTLTELAGAKKDGVAFGNVGGTTQANATAPAAEAHSIRDKFHAKAWVMKT